MSIIIKLNKYTAWEYGREALKDNFSIAGFDALFEYLEAYSEATEEPLKFDPISWRCKFSEMSLEELKENYTDLLQGCGSLEECVSVLQDHTTVIKVAVNAVIVGES